jgi:[ribosomal protein S5]-alanine N-acetyltransferase
LPHEVEALVAGNTEQGGRLAGIQFPANWPEEIEARDGLAWNLRHLLMDPRHAPWRIRVMVDRSSGSVIGSINLKGPPTPEGDVRIGWGVVSDRRGQGYAFEAAAAVTDWARRQPGVKSTSATIPTDNLASQRLAMKLGMTETADEVDGLPLWRRTTA